MTRDAELNKALSCDVGLVFALSIEAGGFEDRLSGLLAIKGPPFRVRQGVLQGRRVVLIVSGPGRDAAARSTDVLISGHRPRLVVSAGFAGGLSPTLQRGEIVIADSVTNEDGKRLAIKSQIDADRFGIKTLHVGRVLTVNRIVHQAVEKQALGERYEAVAVDMESIAVAEVCQRHQTPCAVVRIISDAANEELPADIERLLRPTGFVRRLGTVTGTVFRRPSSVKDLWKLKEGAILASDRLAKFLEQVIGELPGPRDR